METITEKKAGIINKLDLLTEEKLNNVEMFIQFLIYEKPLGEKLIQRKKNKKNDNDFFEICGIWQDRNIDVNSLRKKAWRNIEW